MLFEPKTKLEILKTSKYIYKNIMSEIDIINSTIESYKPNTMRKLRRILIENFGITFNKPTTEEKKNLIKNFENSTYISTTSLYMMCLQRENFDIDDNLVGEYSRAIPTLITINLNVNKKDLDRAFWNWRISDIFINIEPLEISYCTSSTGTLQLKDNTSNDYDEKITDGYEVFSMMYFGEVNKDIASIRYLEPDLFFLNNGEEEDTHEQERNIKNR